MKGWLRAALFSPSTLLLKTLSPLNKLFNSLDVRSDAMASATGENMTNVYGYCEMNATRVKIVLKITYLHDEEMKSIARWAQMFVLSVFCKTKVYVWPKLAIINDYAPDNLLRPFNVMFVLFVGGVDVDVFNDNKCYLNINLDKKRGVIAETGGRAEMVPLMLGGVPLVVFGGRPVMTTFVEGGEGLGVQTEGGFPLDGGRGRPGALDVWECGGNYIWAGTATGGMASRLVANHLLHNRIICSRGGGNREGKSNNRNGVTDRRNQFANAAPFFSLLSYQISSGVVYAARKLQTTRYVVLYPGQPP